MLSHALGATKSTSNEDTGSQAHPVHQVEQVASFLNEKVHSLSSNIMAEHDRGPTKNYGFDFDKFVSSLPTDLWKMMEALTVSRYVNHR